MHPREALSDRAYVLFYRLRGTEGKAVREFNAALPTDLGSTSFEFEA